MYQKQKINLKILKNYNSNFFEFTFEKFSKIIFPEVQMGNISLYNLVLNKQELKLISFINKIKKKYTTIYDVGANVGLHSAFYSQMFKKVVAYEPYDFHLSKLKLLKKINKITNLKIINKAVAGDSKNRKFLIMLSNTTANNLMDADRSRYGKIIKQNVMCENINKIHNKGQLIKLDVEGFEGKIFQSIIFTKKKNKNSDYIVEIHNIKNAKIIFDILKKIKIYEVFLIKEKKIKKIKTFNQFPKRQFNGHIYLKKKEI